MQKYTLISARDPYDSKETGHYVSLAADLRKAGNEVTLFLVQNGVFAARKAAASQALAGLARDGVQVLADSFSLRERGISPERLQTGVQPAELDTIVDHLAEGRRVIWH